jgi:two-component system phosphate regulon sensor histidine kinase PhoR
MFVTPRAVSLLLAFSISVITIAFLSLMPNTTAEQLFVAGALSFSSAFILIYAALKFMIFRQIEKIHDELSKISQDQPAISPSTNYQYGNPLKQINREIIDYVSQKENEIDQLRKMETYRREFIADIYHELKTPIFAAQGYILTLQDGAVNDKKVRDKFLKKAGKSLVRLDMLVKDLLTLSRIESGAIVMNLQICDIHNCS